MSAAAELERVFLPLLRQEQSTIAAHYPQFEFSTQAGPVGGATSYQAHFVWLNCIFPDATPEEADVVSVSVGAMHLATEPKLCEASVSWGHGRHPPREVELIAEPVAFTPEALSQVAARMPELLAVFRSAVQGWQARNGDA